MPHEMKVVSTEKRIINGREMEVVTVGPVDPKRERLRRERFVGCPWEFFETVSLTTKGKTALQLALLIYRRCKVCKSQTVTLPSDELAALGIIHQTSHKALWQLQAAGLVQLHPTEPGHKTIITLLWPR